MRDKPTSRSKRRPAKRPSTESGATGGERDSGSASRRIGDLFRSARKAQQLTQDEVATLTMESPARLSRTMISIIENGRSLPGLESLVALSNALHVDTAEVLEVLQTTGGSPVSSECSQEELSDRALKFFWAGDYRSALATWDAMLHRLFTDPPQSEKERARLHARIEVNRAATFRRLGALRAAQAGAERALSLADGIPALQAEAYIVMSAILVEKGCLPLARDVAASAVSLSQSAEVVVRSRAHNQQGDALYASGAFHEALSAFRTARRHAIESRDDFHRVKTEGNIGACLLELGQAKKAEARFLEAVKLARKYGDPQSESRWMVELGRLALDDGRLDDADRLAAGALRIARPRDLILTTFRAEWLRHRVVRQQRPDAADSQRLARLKRLLPRLRDHREVEEVKQYRTLASKETQA